MMKNFIKKRTTNLDLLFIVLAILTSCSQSTKEVSIESLLNEMVDRDAMTLYPESNFRLKQQSSYNRASVSPDDPEGWFMNHDFNSNDKDHNFVRIEEKNGEKEWVLMDHEGAGAIVRTWMPWLKAQTAGTDIQMKIYLDGNEEPTLKGNMLEIFNGDGLIPFPLAHKSLRSAVSFFPIPYANSCKITTDKRPFFFQFTYREYPEGTAVKTFTMDDFETAKELTQQVGETILNPNVKMEGEQVSLKTSLETNQEKSIDLTDGVAAVRSLSIKLDNYDSAFVTRAVILKMNFDGKETVWCPIGDFFGTGIGLHPFQGWHNTVNEDGTMTSRWVMPYRKSGSISIVNLGKETVSVEVEAIIGDYKWQENSMYFNAAWHGQYPVPTRPRSDWNYVTLKGRGVFAGDALTIYNPVEKWWGEGDERIWVDGEDFPSIFGTGTEDYYAYSWGGMSTDFYEHPFHAQPRSNVYNKLNRKTKVGERNTLGYSTETRTRSLDGMPFSSSLQLDMEVWSGTDCEMAYGVGVMWYGDSTTTANRVPDPEGALLKY